MPRTSAPGGGTGVLAALGPEKDIQHKQLARHQHRSRFGLLKHEFKTERRVCAKEPLKSIGSALITDRGLSCAAAGAHAILLLHVLLGESPPGIWHR